MWVFLDLSRTVAALTGLEQPVAPVRQHCYWPCIEVVAGCHSLPAMAGDDVCMEGICLAFALLHDLVRNSCDLPISLESTCVASAAN